MKDIFDLVKKRIKLFEYAAKVMKLKLVGNRYVGLCPFHHEKTPSFYINPEQDLFYCFGCNKGGDLFTFHCLVYNCEKKDALKELSLMAGIRYITESTKNDLNTLLQYFRSNSMHLEWLKLRGISLESIDKFQLGFSKAFFDMNKFIKQNKLDLNRYGFKESLLQSLQNRVMFPIFNEIGSLVSFSGRTLQSDSNFKYINGTESEIFHKSDILYGLNFIKNKDEIYLVEGYLDVIMMDQSGYSSVAAMGTALNEGHLQKLWTYTDKIVIALDGDDAGIKASERISILSLNIIKSGKELYFIQFPKKHDPASYLKEFHSLKNCKQYPLYEYILLNKEIPTNPDGRAAFFSKLNELATQILDKNLMFEYKKYWNNIRYSKKKNGQEKISKLTKDYLLFLLFKYVICYPLILDHVAEDFLKIKMDNFYMENLINLLNKKPCDISFLNNLKNIYIELKTPMEELLNIWYDIYDKIQNDDKNSVLESLSEEHWENYKKSLLKENNDES